MAMRWLKDIGIDILIFAIAFFGAELLIQWDVFRFSNIFVEFILFLVIYVVAYIIIKFVWSRIKKSRVK